MSTIITAARAVEAGQATTKSEAKSGFFGRLIRAMGEARQRQADREVEMYLARQPSRMLEDIGLSQTEIDALRSKHGH